MVMFMDVVNEFVIRRLKVHEMNDNFEWFCYSIGLVSPRDKERTSVKIFDTLLEAAVRGHSLTTDDIAKKVGVTRGAVIHHLNRMIELGLIIQRGGKYMLRVNNLEELVDEIERDIQSTIKIIRKISESLDKKIKLVVK